MAQLRRLEDNLSRDHEGTISISFNKDGSFKAKEGNKPIVGCSVVIGVGSHLSWQTALVTEILEDKGEFMFFKTQNSNYELRSDSYKWRWCNNCGCERGIRRKMGGLICTVCDTIIQ